MYTLQESLKGISEKHLGNFSVSEGKWFNGNGYLPFYNYFLKIDFESGSIKVNYEFKSNEFSKNMAVDLGSHSDRHTCSIICDLQNSTQLYPFEIRPKSILNQLFNSELLQVKCKNETFTKTLRDDKVLNELYLLSKESSSFKPYISGFRKENEFIVEVHFGNNKSSPEVIDKFIQWLQGLGKR